MTHQFSSMNPKQGEARKVNEASCGISSREGLSCSITGQISLNVFRLSLGNVTLSLLLP